MASKRILVIGGTGAQGFAVVRALLAASPSYTVRVLSRNPESENTQKKFVGTDVELVKGSFMDFDSVERALQGCYGVFVNTDGFTVKESDEIWAGIRIFEIAKRIPTLRHLVYSSIDYLLKLMDFDPKYGAHHMNAKGRVNEYLRSQPSSTTENGLTWSILVTGVYAEMLFGGLFAPVIQPDGTRVFALPLGNGHIPLETLSDLGAFALAMFQNREEWSGKTLNTVSHFATGQEIAETLHCVAGIKAVYKPITFDEWIAEIPFADAPVSAADPEGITVKENFRMWWPGLKESILLKLETRDMELLRRVHPGIQSLEQWMRETGYDGLPKPLLKGFIDNNIGPGF